MLQDKGFVTKQPRKQLHDNSSLISCRIRDLWTAVTAATDACGFFTYQSVSTDSVLPQCDIWKFIWEPPRLEAARDRLVRIELKNRSTGKWFTVVSDWRKRLTANCFTGRFQSSICYNISVLSFCLWFVFHQRSRMAGSRDKIEKNLGKNELEQRGATVDDWDWPVLPLSV